MAGSYGTGNKATETPQEGESMIRGTREAICNALAHAYMGNTNTANFQDYGCPIDRSSGNQAYLMTMQVQYAKIRAAISAQKPHISAWIIYCFGPDVEALHKTDKQEIVAGAVIKEAFTGRYSAKMATRIKKIAHLAVLDYRIGQVMGNTLPVSSYLEAIGYSGSQWARDYEPLRRDALMVVKGYDSTGIANVSVVCRRIREAEENS